jgi:hypothetical protein
LSAWIVKLHPAERGRKTALYNASTITKTIKKSALKTSPPFPDTLLTH